ncbi:hypothetical protein ROZALSC1DRAFT_31259 [Rozella allomycis CSF55]|uniref:TLDc domain-containing protein n=1 Tax=Rozella allomycis (strain CSF55) TaxID=988480 RepID=A0A075B2X3_ROZAC|nr:hypothetical protein O9G_001398 [Rozella allomycis CSF55]RKP16883.1 hypothetical protein ROZALSC1DRAFT_31259 [Rozella allomycis CSF55]|eukprot:EPZ36953.1 hypothetical protein O9G_001398 [Rozella allomycis CSF55]
MGCRISTLKNNDIQRSRTKSKSSVSLVESITEIFITAAEEKSFMLVVDSLSKQNDCISLSSFTEYLELNPEFSKLMYKMMATEDLNLRAQDMLSFLNCLFDMFWTPTSPKMTSTVSLHSPNGSQPLPATQKRIARRSLSFSRHYRYDRRSMLSYILMSSFYDASNSYWKNEKPRLTNEFEFELMDDIIITKKQVVFLLSVVADVALRDYSMVNNLKAAKSFDQGHLNELIENIFLETSSKSEIKFRDLYEWFDKNSPQFFNPLDVHIYTKFFCNSEEAVKGYRGPLSVIPCVDGMSSFLTAEEVCMISTALPVSYLFKHHKTVPAQRSMLHPQWKKIFSSHDYGHSIKQFEFYCVDYPAPSILFIHAEDRKTKEAMIVGAYINQPWKSRRLYWGDRECFVFELSPHFEILHTKPMGIGFGGSEKDGFMFSIENTLMNGAFLSSKGNTYHASRHRIFHVDLDIICVEVYGLGGPDAFDRWKKEKHYNEIHAENRRNVNVKQDVEVEKVLLEMMGTHEFQEKPRINDFTTQ